MRQILAKETTVKFATNKIDAKISLKSLVLFSRSIHTQRNIQVSLRPRLSQRVLPVRMLCCSPKKNEPAPKPEPMPSSVPKAVSVAQPVAKQEPPKVESVVAKETTKVESEPNPVTLPIPPIAKKVPYKHKYHGVEYHDDYHWMKDQNPDGKRQEIIDYLTAENEYTKALHLTPNKPITDSLFNEIISKISEDDSTVPYFKEPYYYYSRVEKGKQYRIFARKKGSLDAPEEIILDQNTFTYEYQSLEGYEVSPDHKILAYALDTDGSEYSTIFFKNLETGELLESDAIQRAAGEPLWANDSKTVFYPLCDDVRRRHKIMKHRIGSDHSTDELVYFEPDTKFYAGTYRSDSGKYIFFHSGSSLTTETSYISADEPDSPVKTILAREYKHKYFVQHQDDRFIIRTNNFGRTLNYSLKSTLITNTEKSAWEDIIPYDPFKELHGITVFKNFIAVEVIADAFKKLLILPVKSGKLTGSPEEISFDAVLYDASVHDSNTMNYDSSILRFGFETPVSPSEVWQYDMSSKERKRLKKSEVTSQPDASLYALERINVPIPPETLTKAPFDTPTPDSIPISIIYRKDKFKGDGTNPLHLYGYGSYGICIEPYYMPKIFPLIDRGIVYAIAHIRGGGDCGRAWYETAKFKTKINTFTDFITCGDELVKRKYTQNSLMSMEGRSAGGMLMGSVLNMRPDLTNVAIAGVPFVDVINTMMDETIPLTINEYEEWGNPNEKDFFDYMRSYSPYDNVPTGKTFPNLLIKAGINDPRVAYWEPAKWTAKLRDLNVVAPGNHLLFDCTMGAGHFGVSGRYARYHEIAGDFAFLIACVQKKLKELGLPELKR